jgi:hypothetical protein
VIWGRTVLLPFAALATICSAVGAATAHPLGSSGAAVKPKCLVVPAPLTRLLRSSLAFSSGGQLFYTRAVKSPSVARVYFVSAQIRSSQLGTKRPIGTWAVDKLDATAVASPINGAARAYSDLATPDGGTVKLTMRTSGATASQACVTRQIR